MRGAHQPRRPVDRRSVVVTVTDIRWACMDAHTHPQWPGGLPSFHKHLALRGDRCINGIMRGAECGMKAVAHRLHDMPPMRADSVTQNLVMTSQREVHCLRHLLPQTRRALDVSEQEGNRS